MKRSIDVPVAAIVQVAALISDHELEHEITAGDESAETITLEINYDRDQRDIIHEIEDLVEDHMEDGEA